jgi:hypothetical protein
MPELNNPVTLISFIFTLYNWGSVCILLLFMFFIAQFYERKSGQRSYYFTFIIAIILFLAGVYRYIYNLPTITGDLMGDLAFLAGSIITTIFGLLLLKNMMGG